MENCHRNELAYSYRPGTGIHLEMNGPIARHFGGNLLKSRRRREWAFKKGLFLFSVDGDENRTGYTSVLQVEMMKARTLQTRAPTSGTLP